MISAIVLAAGESKRMGRPKQMLAWRGKTLLRHVLESLIHSDVDEIVLVLGHEAEAIGKSLSDLLETFESRIPERKMSSARRNHDFHRPHIEIVINQDYTQGMASSLQAGLRALDPKSEAFLVILADQPGIGPEIINRMIRGFREADPRRGIVRPLYRGRGGHPVLIGARYLEEALQLHGDVGARQILSDHPGDILEIDVDQDAVLRDIDTPAEYEKLTR